MKSKNSAEKMSLEEIEEVIRDLEKEKSDLEFEDTFNRERMQKADRIASEKGFE